MKTHTFTVAGIEIQSRVDQSGRVVRVDGRDLSIREADELIRALVGAVACANRDVRPI